MFSVDQVKDLDIWTKKEFLKNTFSWERWFLDSDCGLELFKQKPMCWFLKSETESAAHTISFDNLYNIVCPDIQLKMLYLLDLRTLCVGPMPRPKNNIFLWSLIK